MTRAADAVRATLVAGTAMWLVLGHSDRAVSLGLIAVTACAVRFAGAPPRIELVFVVGAALDGWLTTLGAFDSFNRGDHIGHLVLPAAVTPVLFQALRRAGAVAPGIGRLPAAVVAASGTIALGTVWELVERGADVLLGTRMSLGYTDTLGDLLADSVGAAIGAAFVALTLIRRRTGAADP